MLLVLAPAASALLNFDGTRNQLFIFGHATFAYSSNIFADSTGRGDTSLDAGLGVELRRRAGLIAIGANAKIDSIWYDRYSDQNAVNPNLSLSFDKSTGRTTGTLTVSAFRESRSDAAINLRTNSWNFPLALGLKYPLNEKFYATSDTGYLHRQFSEATGLVNYTEYSEGVNLFYTYTSKLDFSGGYRLRYSETSDGKHAADHWFNVGATGGLLPKLIGTVRVGYQLRQLDDGRSFSQLSTSAAVMWPVTRKLNFSGQLSRDFNTIATGVSVQSTTLALTGTYSYNRKLDLHASASLGRNDFVGLPPPARTDNFAAFDVGAGYKMNDHFEAGVGYSFFRNASTLSFSTFDRNLFSVDVSVRY